MIFLPGGLVLGEWTGGGSAGQSAWEDTGGGVVAVLRLGGLLGASDTGAGDCWVRPSLICNNLELKKNHAFSGSF